MASLAQSNGGVETLKEQAPTDQPNASLDHAQISMRQRKLDEIKQKQLDSMRENHKQDDGGVERIDFKPIDFHNSSDTQPLDLNDSKDEGI